MPAVNTVLVVGSGLAGAATAIGLAEGGVDVDLVEISPDLPAVGSGITLQGNALRELRRLGAWELVRDAGYAFDSLGLRAPDPDGSLIVEMPDQRTGGEDLPATVGMSRPELARILHERALAAGVKVRFGAGPVTVAPDGAVTFTDGGSGRYDLVVGADGVRSRVRDLVGIDAGVRPVGMGIWRAFGPRPSSVTRTDLYYGGPALIAGYCPTGEDSLYAYVVERAQDRTGLSPRQRLDTLRGLAAGYHGPWDDVRQTLVDPARVHYTWFETHVLPAPWHRGRTVVIGDAAHSCPPTVAQGGALALEDAAVLTELLLGADVLDDRLWTAFTDRRHDRVRTVVDASNQLCRWLLDGERGDVPGLMHRVADLVSRPA